MAEEKQSRDTVRGFHSPEDPQVRVSTLPSPRPSLVPKSDPRSPAVVEWEEVREVGTPTLLSGPYCALEVWTENRVYALDLELRCAAVRDRATGLNIDDHPVLGARLLGGQNRNDEGALVSVAQPLPLVGMAAIFAKALGKRKQVTESRNVERVVFRQRIVTLCSEEQAPAERISQVDSAASA